MNQWIKNWRSRQLLFQRIYNCRKSRNADPSAAAVAQDFMPRLGTAWYAGLWFAHKITKPLANLRRWCQKALRPRPAEIFPHSPENSRPGALSGRPPRTLEGRLAPGQCFDPNSASAPIAFKFESHEPSAISIGSPPASNGGSPDPDLIIIATGSEVSISVEAAERLAGEGIRARVVSMPSWDLFAAQPKSYRDEILPPTVRARLSVESASSFGWERWIGDEGASVSLDHFGASAPGARVMAELGFTADNVAEHARSLVQRVAAGAQT